MGLRSLAQVLLGMFGFVLVVELITAVGNDTGTVDIGGAGIGAGLLLLALIGDVGALVAVSVSGRDDEQHAVRGGTPGTATRSECSQCGWTTRAPTMEQAQILGQQHLYEAHGGPAPTQ